MIKRYLEYNSKEIESHSSKHQSTCINSHSFQNSCTFETGLSNFYKITLTVLKKSFAKQKPRILNYRNYKFFNNTLYRDQVLNKLRNSNLQISDKDLKPFKETYLSVVKTIALWKCRFMQASQAPFINKEMQRLLRSGQN